MNQVGYILSSITPDELETDAFPVTVFPEHPGTVPLATTELAISTADGAALKSDALAQTDVTTAVALFLKATVLCPSAFPFI